MSHLERDQQKLLNRVRRIRGQINGIEKALETERDATATLQMIAACRGAINGLMGEVMEGHVREHVLDPDHPPSAEQARAADELLRIVRTYLK